MRPEDPPEQRAHAADLPSRKLAAILHADVADSTVLVQAHETLAHERIRQTFHDLSEIVALHGGSALEIRGDALVAEFSRASDALDAALTFQERNAARLDRIDDAVRPAVRIGIAMAEVVIADGTVTGEGVVLAQRLEQLAEPGGVCIQDAASQTVPRRLAFRFHDLGERTLKGFDEPVRAHVVTRATTAESAARSVVPVPGAEVTLELPELPSIAVLPFDNMSGDAEQEYFSDGITEDIITALSHISGLLVIARNSTMTYKGAAVDVKQVGREQGVRYVLEGSVRTAGERVRVTAQLIDATTGHHLWAERYDRTMDDVFAVQDDITHRIMIEMRVQMSVGEKARLLAGRTRKVEAWERLARADELNNSIVRSSNEQARRLLEEAVAIDSDYVSAWTELGWVHWADACFGWSSSLERSMRAAHEAAEKALAIEPDYPNACSLIGCLALIEGDFDRALEQLEKGVELAPNSAENVAELAFGLAQAGRVDDAMETIRRAIRLSPICPSWYLAIVGLCHWLAGDLDRARTSLREAVEREPDSNWARVYLVSALVDGGQLGAAEHTAREIVSREPGFALRGWSGIRFRDAELTKRMIANLRRAGLPG